MRVPDFLVAQAVPFESLLHPPAFTAQKRARFLHLPGRQVAKVVLLHGPDGYVLAVLPATRHVDAERLAAALGGPVRLADDAEIVRRVPRLRMGRRAAVRDALRPAGGPRRQHPRRRADGLRDDDPGRGGAHALPRLRAPGAAAPHWRWPADALPSLPRNHLPALVFTTQADRPLPVVIGTVARPFGPW